MLVTARRGQIPGTIKETQKPAKATTEIESESWSVQMAANRMVSPLPLAAPPASVASFSGLRLSDPMRGTVIPRRRGRQRSQGAGERLDLRFLVGGLPEFLERSRTADRRIAPGLGVRAGDPPRPAGERARAAEERFTLSFEALGQLPVRFPGVQANEHTSARSNSLRTRLLRRKKNGAYGVDNRS